MHNGQINGTLDIELEVAGLKRLLDNRIQPQGFPQTAEDQVRTDSLDVDRFSLAGGVRVNDRQFLTKAQARTHERVQLPGGLEKVQASDRAQDALMHVALLAEAFYDLEIGIGAGAFDSKIHSAISFPLQESGYRSRSAIST
jgi:hypothetical protein